MAVVGERGGRKKGRKNKNQGTKTTDENETNKQNMRRGYRCLPLSPRIPCFFPSIHPTIHENDQGLSSWSMSWSLLFSYSRFCTGRFIEHSTTLSLSRTRFSLPSQPNNDGAPPNQGKMGALDNITSQCPPCSLRYLRVVLQNECVLCKYSQCSNSSHSMPAIIATSNPAASACNSPVFSPPKSDSDSGSPPAPPINRIGPLNPPK